MIVRVGVRWFGGALPGVTRSYLPGTGLCTSHAPGVISRERCSGPRQHPRSLSGCAEPGVFFLFTGRYRNVMEKEGENPRDISFFAEAVNCGGSPTGSH